jgi:chemotaxis signal transduction protein
MTNRARQSASSGSARQGPVTTTSSHDTVCAFWLGSRCYGVSTSIVGEVAAVEYVLPVPLAPAAIVGVFSLRGSPIALVDTEKVLGLPVQRESAQLRNPIALVVRTGANALAGLRIDRMESVVGLEHGQWSPRDWSAEHAAVGGFLELPERQLVITLLDSHAVIERLSALRYR